jgi:two-component system, chemotaxis family, response regulator Rcp1
MHTHDIDILLVEDNPGDARLVQEAFAEWRLVNTIHHVTDGVEAMEFLHRRGQYADRRKPDLVLLDLNLPRKDGREVLAEMKADPNLKTIPVVALTTSSAKSDIDACYQAGANAYVCKPLDFSEFMSALTALRMFWFSVVSLPAEEL